jgi:hypothetical protein
MVATGYKGSRQYLQEIWIDKVTVPDPAVSIEVNPTCSACKGSQSTVTRNLEAWNIGQPATFVITLPETGGYDKEKRVDSGLGAAIAVMGKGGLPGAWPIYSTQVRCDSATYQSFKQACIFTIVQSQVLFHISDPNALYGASARFIQGALKNPAGTIPTVPGKFIPSYLHRMYPAGSRSRVQAACKAHWGTDYSKGGKFQCDEYPFASAEEGAGGDAKTTDWAVEVIPGAENTAGGQAIIAWYNRDRILNGDGYTVRVVP